MSDPARRTPPDGLEIRLLNSKDPTVISAAFNKLGWNKPVERYERYFSRQNEGLQDVLVATVEKEFAGYVPVLWKSGYKPFADVGIPEINDFNVLPKFRRKGVGTALLDEAERRAKERSDVVGIGVGMTSDYGAAQRMYPKRGYVPDGRGLTQEGIPVVHNQPIRVNDSTVLWFTKKLR